MAINRDQFLAAAKGERRYVEVPIALLGSVRLQSLTNKEMRAIRASLRNDDGEPIKERFDRLDAILVAATVVDEHGSTQFTDTDAMTDTFSWVDAGPWGVLCDAVRKHTGWGADASWKPIENAAKN